MQIGIVVIVVVVVLFYLRLYLIQRGKQRLEKIEMLQRMKKGKKGAPPPPRDPYALTFKVKSWWIIVPGMLLMLLGVAIYSQGFLPEINTYWWVPVALGGVLFIFGFE